MRSHSRIAASDMRQKKLSSFIRQVAHASDGVKPCRLFGLRTAGAGVRKVIVWGLSAIMALGILAILSLISSAAFRTYGNARDKGMRNANHKRPDEKFNGYISYSLAIT